MQTAYTVEQIKNRLVPIFYRNHERKAVLFGSYSKGTATPESNVDIWVDSGMHGLPFFGLLEDVCQAMECPVDLIDKIDVIPGSQVDQEIGKTAVVIFEQ